MKSRWIVLIALIAAAVGFFWMRRGSIGRSSGTPHAIGKHAAAPEISAADRFAKLRDSEVKGTFAELDRNKDGKVDAAELPSALNARLLEADKDGDRALSVEEVEVLTGPWRLATYERFLKLDANGDGVLKDQEIEAAKVKNWQSEDWNGDGAVAIAEFNRLVEGG